MTDPIDAPKKNTSYVGWIAFIIALLGVGYIVLFGGIDGSKVILQPNTADLTSYAQKIANLDGVKDYLNPDNTQVIRNQYLLTELHNKFFLNELQLSEIAFKGKKMLHDKYGKDVTISQLLEGVNKSSVQPASGTFEENIATWVALLAD